MCGECKGLKAGVPLRSQGSCSGREDGAWRVDGVDLGHFSPVLLELGIAEER